MLWDPVVQRQVHLIGAEQWARVDVVRHVRWRACIPLSIRVLRNCVNVWNVRKIMHSNLEPDHLTPDRIATEP